MLYLRDYFGRSFLFSAKAIDEYANLKSKAAESNDNVSNVDPRLEAIVERMLNKYVNLYLLILRNASISNFFLVFLWLFHLGASWMVSTNKLWELQLNVEDWTNLRKQSQRVIMFMELYHIALMFLIPL